MRKALAIHRKKESAAIKPSTFYSKKKTFPNPSKSVWWKFHQARIATRPKVRTKTPLNGYKYNLSFKTPTPHASRKRKYHQRNILLFTPPYSQNVETKLGKCFLQLTDQHFPKTNPLYKLFNWNTLKVN